MILGLQGSGLLSSLIKSPIYLSSIVVSLDERSDEVSQLKALKRALVDRAKAIHSQLTQIDTANVHYPDLFIVPAQFPQGKSAVEKQEFDIKFATVNDTEDHFPKKKQKLTDGSTIPCITSNGKARSPVGMSTNWQCEPNIPLDCFSAKHQNVELVVGTKGMKQGKKIKSASDIVKSASRLSSWSLFHLGLECIEHLMTDGDGNATFLNNHNGMDFINECKNGKISYQEVKHSMGDPIIRAMKGDIFRSGPFSGWVCDARDFHLLVSL